MKKRKRINPILALTTFIVFFMNILTPAVVQAKALTKENTITISVERRVLGQADIVSEREVKLKGQEERTSELFDRVMKDLGIAYENTGSLDNAFYVSSINTQDQGPLAEFDHGIVSGWMYSVNGDFKNVGMSEYYVKPGDAIRVCYTTKDYAKSIMATDKVHKLRESISNAEALDKNAYTEESFLKLEEALKNAKVYNYSDEEIGKMMSDTLGTGDCNTEELIKKVESALNSVKTAIDNLKKVEVEELKEDISINLYKWDNQESKNTIYFKEGQESINVLLEKMGSNEDVWLNDKKLVAINDKYVVALKKGINKFKIIRWGNPVEVVIPCIELPYEIEGNLTPGSTVKVKLKGLEEAIKSDEKHSLEKSQTQFKSDITGVSKITSKMYEGLKPDREALGTLEFKIPTDVKPGAYNLTEGSIYHQWGGTSVNGDFKGNFSILPDIKLEIKEGIDESKIQDINLNIWTAFDKVYTTENEAYVRVNNEEKSIIKLIPGANKVNIDGKDYSIECKKISYKVLNANAITPGSTVKITFDGLKEAFLYMPSEYNPNDIKTVYNTNIKGLETVSSVKAGYYTDIDYNKLNYIEFTLPKDVKVGEHNLVEGGIYQSWWGKEIAGSTATSDGGYQRKFSILPNIKFNVVETAPEDKEAPVITTSLKETQEVKKSDFRFNVLATDNEDGRVEPVVKYEDEVLEHNGSNWYTVKLLDGENVINVEATDKAGNKVSKEYKIICTPVLKEGSSIILDTLSLELDKGQKHKLIAVEADDNRSNSNDATARMTYEVTEGNNIVKVSKSGEVEALDYGLAKISVKYPGLKIPAVVQVNVKKVSDNTPEIVTDIMNKYDTFYFEEDTSKYNFKVESKDADVITVKVNGNVISEENNLYSTPLVEGYNTIQIIAEKGEVKNTKLYTVKAKKISIAIKNVSNEGKEILQGDKVRIEFKGLETPVPKFLRVYNPKKTRVNYETNVPGMTDIDGEGSQYYIATNNAIEFIAIRPGEFTFSKGSIHEDWWGEELFSEKGIEGLPPNLSASVINGVFSSLPNFTINVKENPNFKDRFNPVVVNGDNLQLGQEVTVNIPDMVMPDGVRALEAYTEFDTNIKGLGVIFSEDAANDENKLKTVKFTLPKDTKPGIYTITNGRVFMEYDDGGALWKNGEFFKGEIPEIKITVKDEANPEVKPEEINSVPQISAENVEIKVGDTFEPLKYAVAKDKEDDDSTLVLKVVENTVDTTKAGEYKVTYSVTDSKGASTTKTIVVKVISDNKIPVITEETKNKLMAGINNASKWIIENVKNPTFENEWDILGLVRGDIKVSEDYYEKYYNGLVEVVKEKKGVLHRSKYTEYSRVIIALSALGKDPTNVGGYNLLEKIYDYNKVSRQGINGIVYALIALDTKNYEAPEGYREKLIDEILKKQLEDGGFALTGKKGDADITAMTLQALSKYKNQEKVKSAIDKAVAFLSEIQLANGGFGGVDGENLESSAQVLVALNALGINLNDTRFVKNNRNLVDVMIEYSLENGGFKHLLSQDKADGMSTEQALYSLVSLKRFVDGKTSLYDMSDDVKPEPDANNAPQISAEDVEIKVGDTFDPLKYVVATDKEDDDSTLVIKVVENTVDTTKAGEYKVTYSVTDSKGAITTKTIVVKVISDIKPEPDIKPEEINNAPQISAENMEIKVGDTFDPLKYAVATDKEDDDSTLVIKVVENTVDTTKAGEYKVTYSVTDSKGAITTKTIVVKVSLDKEESGKPDDNGNGNTGNNNNGNNGSNGSQGGKPSIGKPGLPQTGSEAAIVLSLIGIVSIGAGVSLRKNKK